MKFRLLFAPVLAWLVFGTAPALADACSGLARQTVSATPGATLLSVQASTKSNGKVVCTIRMKLPPKNGEPGRVVTRKKSPG